MNERNRAWGVIAIFVAVMLASCETTPEAPKEAKISDEVTAQATVVDINEENRELILERPNGSYLRVVAGPEVRNFDQIVVGNTVTARYVVSLSARRLEPGEPDVEPTLGVAAARAVPGQSPAAGIGADVVMTVVVKTVDLDQNIVTFTDPRGILHAIEAERDEGKAFVKGLKSGDRVELKYEEVLVMAVE